jgi:dihydroorotase
MIKDGFIPDSISTDLHVTSMNGSMKDELNTADKILALGVPLKEVVAEMTSHPAKEIKHEELGNLSEGSIADVAVLRVEKGKFGFTDMVNLRHDGSERLVCELTVKGGKVVYDLNGISSDPWTAQPGQWSKEAWRWTTFAPHRTPHAGAEAH